MSLTSCVLPTFGAATMLIASAACGQSTNNPFPAPIPAADGAILVKFVEFAAIPYAGSEAPRMMLLLDERGRAARNIPNGEAVSHSQRWTACIQSARETR